MMTDVIETNKAILLRFIEEAWHGPGHVVCDELLAPNYRHYMPGEAQPTIGIEPYKQLLKMFTTAFPDSRLKVDEIFGEADRVCALWTFRGTQEGVFNGLQATGRSVILPGVAVARVEHSKIQEVRSMFDRASIMEQLGV